MKEFVITTDNMADLPSSYYEENQIPYMFLTYTMDGVTYHRENQLSSGEF